MFTIVQNYLATFISTFLLIGWGDRFPKGIVIGIDALLMGFLLFGIETLPPYLVLMLLFSTLNMTTGILNNLITAFVSDIYGEKNILMPAHVNHIQQAEGDQHGSLQDLEERKAFLGRIRRFLSGLLRKTHPVYQHDARLLQRRRPLRPPAARPIDGHAEGGKT